MLIIMPSSQPQRNLPCFRQQCLDRSQKTLSLNPEPAIQNSENIKKFENSLRFENQLRFENSGTPKNPCRYNKSVEWIKYEKGMLIPEFWARDVPKENLEGWPGFHYLVQNFIMYSKLPLLCPSPTPATPLVARAVEWTLSGSTP